MEEKEQRMGCEYLFTEWEYPEDDSTYPVDYCRRYPTIVKCERLCGEFKEKERGYEVN